MIKMIKHGFHNKTKDLIFYGFYGFLSYIVLSYAVFLVIFTETGMCAEE